MFRSALILMVSMTLGSAVALAQQPLRLMANTSPPYADAKLPERGLALELVEHVFVATDVKPEIVMNQTSANGVNAIRPSPSAVAAPRPMAKYPSRPRVSHRGSPVSSP